MMKTFFQALGMAAVLFLYGYFLSTAGHDHAAHQHEETSTDSHSHDDHHH